MTGMTGLQTREMIEDTETLYTFLRDKILAFEFKPGEMLSETALAAQLQLGRPMLREALSQLMEEGYVLVYPQRGTEVSGIDAERLKQTVHAHIVLEQAVLELICRRGLSEAQLNHLESLLREQKHFGAKESALRYVMAEQTFRKCLCEFAGRSFVWDLFRMMDCDLLRLYYLQYTTFNYNVYMSSLTSWEHAQVEERLLFEHLRKRDVDAALLQCANRYNAAFLNIGLLQGIYPGFFSG